MVDDLVIMTATTGPDPAPDGYVVLVEDLGSRPVEVTGTVSFEDVPGGTYVVELTGVPANCTLVGSNPRTVTTVPPGDGFSTRFEVGCVPVEGALEVVTFTGGADPDPDGYTVIVGGTSSESIGLDDLVTFGPLTPSDVSVELTEVAANCTVSGENPRTVRVVGNDTVSTTFEVQCAPGALQVTMVTGGISLPDGFTLSVEGRPDQTIGANESISFSGLPPGDYIVEVSGLPDRCEVVNGSSLRSVTVGSGPGATTFEVRCWAWLVFDSDRAGNWDVFTMRDDGAGQLNLTADSESSDRQPVVSPDGNRIAFASTRSGREHIWVMNRDGTGAQQLTTVNRAKEPYWSPDGTRIVFAARITPDQWDIWVMDASGQNQVNLTDDAANDGRPEWSPDGTQLVFDSDGDVYVMDTDGGGRSLLTEGGGNPTWSPDGSRIAFTGATPDGLDVWVMDADGSNRTNLTSFAGAEDGEPAWSPDGTTIAFMSARDGNREIYLMNPDGTNLRRLTANENQDMWPSWVPIP